MWEGMQERIPEPLIGSDRSHEKWERMRERILGSGCRRGFLSL